MKYYIIGFMKKKYKYIILPPDGFHRTATDTLCNARKFLIEIIDNVKKIKKPEEEYIIKHRGNESYEIYNIIENSALGYGTFIEYCDQNSIVIGPCGTAFFEAIINNISYYSYDFTKAYEKNKMIFNNFSDSVYVADNPKTIFNNIKEKKIYKNGFSKKQIFFEKSTSIKKIITNILDA